MAGANITDKFVVVGDRVLIKPKSLDERTKSGIYLPPGVQEKEKIQTGYIIKTGPGYPVGPPPESDEPWKESVIFGSSHVLARSKFCSALADNNLA